MAPLSDLARRPWSPGDPPPAAAKGVRMTSAVDATIACRSTGADDACLFTEPASRASVPFPCSPRLQETLSRAVRICPQTAAEAARLRSGAPCQHRSVMPPRARPGCVHAARQNCQHSARQAEGAARDCFVASPDFEAQLEPTPDPELSRG